MQPEESLDIAGPNPIWKQRRIRIWAVSVLSITAVLIAQVVWPGRAISPISFGELGPSLVLAAFLAALFCEFIDSALGMGYGTTLTPVLLLVGFEPLQIVPAVLLSECATGLLASALHHRDGNVDFLRDSAARRTALLLGLLSLAGAALAVTVALKIPKVWLTGAIAAIILAVGVFILCTMRRTVRYRRGHIILLGGIAAFNKALSGGGYGPLVTGGQVVSGISCKSAVAITSLAESFTCLMGLGMYILTVGQPLWSLTLPLVAGAILSVPVATLTVRRMPETYMRAGVGMMTCILGILMVLKVSV